MSVNWLSASRSTQINFVGVSDTFDSILTISLQGDVKNAFQTVSIFAVLEASVTSTPMTRTGSLASCIPITCRVAMPSRTFWRTVTVRW